MQLSKVTSNLISEKHISVPLRPRTELPATESPLRELELSPTLAENCSSMMTYPMQSKPVLARQQVVLELLKSLKIICLFLRKSKAKRKQIVSKAFRSWLSKEIGTNRFDTLNHRRLKKLRVPVDTMKTTIQHRCMAGKKWEPS